MASDELLDDSGIGFDGFIVIDEVIAFVESMIAGAVFTKI
jgi:hypothetical protein